MEIRTRIAAIIIKEGKLLMLKGKGYNELWTPGGGVEISESDEDCLKRELVEEIGVEVTSFKFFKEYLEQSFYDPSIALKQRVYLVSISGQIKPNVEIEDFVWLTKQDFENQKYQLITSTQEKVIPDIIEAGLF